MKEDWTKQIAKRAAEHRSKAPDGLLDDVRKEMVRRGLSIETPQRHKTLPRWTPRRTAVAVAATALALAIPVTWIELKKHADSPQIAANDSHTQTINHQPKTALRPSAANAPSTTTAAAYGTASTLAFTYGQPSTTTASVTRQFTAQDAASGNGMLTANSKSDEPATSNTSSTDNHHDDAPTTVQPAPQTQHHTTTRRSYDDPYATNDLALNDLATSRTHKASLSVGAFYGAGNSEDNMGNPHLDAAYDPLFYDYDNHLVLGFVNEPLKVEAHHNMPLRAGLNVAYHLSPRWGVQTGLTYSYLSSDITTTYVSNTVVTKQHLHYLGIPLTASYTIVGNERWKAYITAGGMAEKLIKGQATDNYSDHTSNISEHRLQWSVKAAAGASYHVTPLLSIYVEPGVSHYFDNHSGVVNVYKDRPTTFTLDMGVRMDINK